MFGFQRRFKNSCNLVLFTSVEGIKIGFTIIWSRGGDDPILSRRQLTRIIEKKRHTDFYQIPAAVDLLCLGMCLLSNSTLTKQDEFKSYPQYNNKNLQSETAEL